MTTPEGFAYIPEFLTPNEQATLLSQLLRACVRARYLPWPTTQAKLRAIRLRLQVHRSQAATRAAIPTVLERPDQQGLTALPPGNSVRSMHHHALPRRSRHRMAHRRTSVRRLHHRGQSGWACTPPVSSQRVNARQPRTHRRRWFLVPPARNSTTGLPAPSTTSEDRPVLADLPLRSSVSVSKTILCQNVVDMKR